jgi:hypothetical protein
MAKFRNSRPLNGHNFANNNARNMQDFALCAVYLAGVFSSIGLHHYLKMCSARHPTRFIRLGHIYAVAQVMLDKRVQIKPSTTLYYIISQYISMHILSVTVIHMTANLGELSTSRLDWISHSGWRPGCSVLKNGSH